MSVKEFARLMRSNIEEIKQNGTAAIYCDHLIAYLQSVENSPEPEPTQVDMERYRHELQVANDSRKMEFDSQLEMFRSVIAAGQNAIRVSLLLNGGAAVALLAFIGHLATCSSGQLCSDLSAEIEHFASSLLWFALGALAISVTAGLTYLCQWFGAEAQGSDWREKAAFGINIAAILIGLLSYLAFFIGMYASYIVILGV